MVIKDIDVDQLIDPARITPRPLEEDPEVEFVYNSSLDMLNPGEVENDEDISSVSCHQRLLDFGEKLLTTDTAITDNEIELEVGFYLQITM